MKDFRALKVWEKAHALTLAIYKATDDFPSQEFYSLTNQVQRVAVSIPVNIVEGYSKDSDIEIKQYFFIAMDSSSKLEYLLLLAHDLGYLQNNMYHSMQHELPETRRMLHAFIQK
jgi:four helix bundle protein